MLDVARIRAQFPILAQTVGGKPLAYLDNAATTQKPRPVLDTLARYYAAGNANIHRGVYALSQEATAAYEGARGKVAAFLNAAEPAEIVFTRNATEGINLVAQTFGRSRIGAGDEVVVSGMEHHSNIVPWQLVCEEKGGAAAGGAVLRRGRAARRRARRPAGAEDPARVHRAHVANSLGTVNPVERVVELAHRQGIPVLVDGAQAAYHMPVDVQAIGCDFYVVTGHKLYGPTGIGALYGRRALLEAMPPYQGGGDMIASVTFERTTYNELPHRFEAGTPHIAGAIGLGAALDFITGGRVRRHRGPRAEPPGLRDRGAVRGARAAPRRDRRRQGEHPVVRDRGRAPPRHRDHRGRRGGRDPHRPPLHPAGMMDRLGVPATARASLAMYNTTEEVDQLVAALARVRELFG